MNIATAGRRSPVAGRRSPVAGDKFRPWPNVCNAYSSMKSLSLVLILIIVYAGLPAFAADRKVNFNSEDVKNETDWKRVNFDIVIVINKALNAQTLDVYHDGKLVRSARISTGRNFPHTGYFTAQKLSPPLTVTFGENDFLRPSPFETISEGIFDSGIGQRALTDEGVNLHQQDAREIFNLVQATESPTVIDVDPMGAPLASTHSGFRTLLVVQNIPLRTSPAASQPQPQQLLPQYR